MIKKIINDHSARYRIEPYAPLNEQVNRFQSALKIMDSEDRASGIRWVGQLRLSTLNAVRFRQRLGTPTRIKLTPKNAKYQNNDSSQIKELTRHILPELTGDLRVTSALLYRLSYTGVAPTLPLPGRLRNSLFNNRY